MKFNARLNLNKKRKGCRICHKSGKFSHLCSRHETHDIFSSLFNYISNYFDFSKCPFTHFCTCYLSLVTISVTMLNYLLKY